MGLKLFWKKKSKTEFRSELQALVFMLENGLRAGRDIGSILRAHLEIHPTSGIALNVEKAIAFGGLDFLGTTQSKDGLENILYRMIAKAKFGSLPLSKIMGSYRKLIALTQTMERKQRSLMFIPRFQAFVILLLAGILGIAIPWMMPEIFPSFLRLNRWDLFACGWAIMGMGLLLLRWFCHKPQQEFLEAMNSCLFFQSLSLHLRSGLDFTSSWAVSYEGLSELKRELSASDAKFQTQSEFVLSKVKYAPLYWHPILTQLPWLLELGDGVGDFLEESSLELMRWYDQKWDEDLRRMSALSILPLGLLVFPAALFLMVGPRVLEILG